MASLTPLALALALALGAAPPGGDPFPLIEEASAPGAPAPLAGGASDMNLPTLPDRHDLPDTPADPEPARGRIPGDPSPGPGARGPDAPIPGTHPDAPEVRSSIDRALIRRLVTAHLAEVRRCYEQGLARDPTLAGRIVLDFTIDRRGAVTRAAVFESTLADPAVGACIAANAMRWRFPPNFAGDVGIRYPFVLAPA